jgi:acyl-CoA thioesterase
MEPQKLAQAVGETMFSRDQAARGLGIGLSEIRPGYARMTLRVVQTMLNGHGICHGGFVFTLADTAFAYACNSHNHVTLAAGCAIDFLAPAHEGEILTAIAEERALAGRTGIYDVQVKNEKGETIAMMRGRSARIKGDLIHSPGS